MTVEELDTLLNKGEGIHIEFKEAQNGVPGSLYDTVCSFLNKEGGTIVLGISDDSMVLGLDRGSVVQMKKDIVTALNDPVNLSPPFNLPVGEVEKNNNLLLYIKVPVSSQVHKHGDIIYDREFDSDLRITDQARISEIYFRKRQSFTENQIFPHLLMNNLEDGLFVKARQLIHSLDSTHDWLLIDNERLLRDAMLYHKDFSTGEEGLTLAAALIFGKDETIGNLLPAYKVDAMVRRKNIDRWDDRLPPLRTNLIDTYLKLMAFVKEKLPEKFHIEGDHRVDLREIIFREVVANLIVHREYTDARSTELIIYADRVVATNPNRTIFRGPLLLETFSPYAKNPNIRRFFSAFGWTDEIGSGVRNVNKYLKLYANGASPLFLEEDVFKTIIPLDRLTLGDNANALLEFVGGAREDYGEEKLTLLGDISLNTAFKDITDFNELLFKLGRTWAEKSGKLDKVRFLIDNDLEIEDLKKEGSLTEKGLRLLKKRGKVILQVLIALLQPMSLDDLVSFMGYRSKERFREDYIKPLRDNGLIQLTNPDKPSDPNQQYVISEKGKMYMGGYDV